MWASAILIQDKRTTKEQRCWLFSGVNYRWKLKSCLISSPPPFWAGHDPAAAEWNYE